MNGRPQVTGDELGFEPAEVGGSDLPAEELHGRLNTTGSGVISSVGGVRHPARRDRGPRLGCFEEAGIVGDNVVLIFT